MKPSNYIRTVTLLYITFISSFSGCTCFGLGEKAAPQNVIDFKTSASGDYILYQINSDSDKKTGLWTYKTGSKSKQIVQGYTPEYGSDFINNDEIVLYTTQDIAQNFYWYNLATSETGMLSNVSENKLSGYYNVSFDFLTCHAVTAQNSKSLSANFQQQIGWVNFAKNQIQFITISDTNITDIAASTDCTGIYWLDNGDIYYLAQNSFQIEQKTQTGNYKNFYLGANNQFIGVTENNDVVLAAEANPMLALDANQSPVLTDGSVIWNEGADYLIGYNSSKAYKISIPDGTITLIKDAAAGSKILEVFANEQSATIVEYKESVGFEFTLIALDSVATLDSLTLPCRLAQDWHQISGTDKSNNELFMACNLPLLADASQSKYDDVSKLYSITLDNLSSHSLIDQKWNITTIKTGNGSVILNRLSDGFLDYGEVLYSLDLATGKLKSFTDK